MKYTKGGRHSLLYIDRHLIHEVTSPQAFEGLKIAGRKPWRISSNIATPDHNVPTTDRAKGIQGINDEVAKLQVVTLDENCKEHDILQFDIHDIRQGIVPCRRPRARFNPSRYDNCMWGLTHFNSRGIGNTFHGYWHIRSRACPCNAMPQNI